MKKEDFLAEVARIYFIVNNFVELLVYLKHGYCPKVIDAQLNIIRSVDEGEIWFRVNSNNILEYVSDIEEYIDKKGNELGLRFLTFELDENENVDLQLWFSCMLILESLSNIPSCFLETVLDFFVLHLNCFSGFQYVQLQQLLMLEDMNENALELSEKVHVPNDLPEDVCIQLYDAKYSAKF